MDLRTVVISRCCGAVLLMTLFVVPLLASSCEAVPTQGGGIELREATDDAGRVVKVVRELKRIVSLAPSNTEVLFALGLEDKIVGVTDYCDYPPAAKGKEKVGGFSTVNLEKVISLSPGLVLAANIHRQTVVPELERRGLAVFILDRRTLDGVIQSLETVGKLTGRETEVTLQARIMELKRDEVLSAVGKYSTRPRVFCELSPQLHTVGTGTLINDIITRAGGINIAASVPGEYPQISLEFLVLQDPEVVLLTDMGGDEMQTVEPVLNRPGWRNMTAVKTGRVFVIDPNLVNRPGPRVMKGFEQVARIINSQ